MTKHQTFVCHKEHDMFSLTLQISSYKEVICVYLYELPNYYTFPYKNRDSCHRRAFGNNIVLVHVQKSKNPKRLESDFKQQGCSAKIKDKFNKLK